MRLFMMGVFAFVLSIPGLSVSGQAASAAQISGQAGGLGTIPEAASPMTPVSYRHYCVRQYFKCRDRWGGGWRFQRCMQWRGCWDAYLDYRARRSYYGGCGQWRHACAENWGYGNNDYYGCLRYHGCY